MKTLQDYIVDDRLYASDTGPEAKVGDQVKLFLDQEANPDFPEFILGVIQHPIVRVNCESSTSYVIEYDEADLLGAASLIRPGDVIDATVVTAEDVLLDQIATKQPLDADLTAYADAADAAARRALIGAGTPATTESVLALLEEEQPSIYLSSRFTTESWDQDPEKQGLAILASSSPYKMGFIGRSPLYTPTVPGFRDPSLIYWNGFYFVAYTAGDYGQVSYFSIIKSADLLTWEHVVDVDVDMGAKTWAPEFYLEGSTLYVIVGANTSWPADSSLYRLTALNSSLTAWSAPEVLTGFATPVNDGCLRKIGSTYHLACIVAPAGHVEFFTASNMLGPYTARLTGNHSVWNGAIEGPSLTHLGGSEWLLTGDDPGSSCVSKYATSSDDMATWSTLTLMDQPKNLRHGTTIRLKSHTHAQKIAAASFEMGGNLVDRAIESTDWDGGKAATIGVAHFPYWNAVGEKKDVGWFFANYKGSRTGSGSNGTGSQDAFRAGWDSHDPCSVLVGYADQAYRANLGGVMKTIAAAAQSVTTAPTDLHSYTVPGLSLDLIGQSIVFKSSGRFSSGTANSKECKLYVNGAEVATTGSSAFNATAFQFNLTVTKRSDTTAHLMIEGLNGATVFSAVVDSTITLANAFIIKTVGIGVVTGDIRSDCTQVLWFPANA